MEKIEPLRNYYVCIRSGFADLDTLKQRKRDSIDTFIKGLVEPWHNYENYGWKCVKVNINFEVLNPKLTDK